MAEITQKKVNTKSILDTFTSLKREIFSYLDQILEIDHNISHTTSSNISNASYDNVIILYEKSLSLTHGALDFYEKNKAVLSKSEEAATILNKLNAIKIQIVDRLKVLQSETTAIDKHEFLKIGNEDTTKATDVKVPIVDSNLKSDCIVIDGDEESKINEIESNKKEDSKKVPQAWSADAISDSLTNGAEYLSKGIGTTTEYAAQYIGIGGDKLKSNMVPNSTPAKIDPTLNNVAKNIRYGTHVTVKVSSYLVGKLTSLASYTAKSVAPHIRNGSSQILTKSGFAKNESDASSTLDDVCKVGSSSVKGFVKVYDSLETAAVTLGKNLTEKTVTVVDYKYGTEAAALAENSLYSAGNIAQSVNNAKGLKIRKTFAKATAKEAIYHKHGSENQENTKEIRGSDIYRK